MRLMRFALMLLAMASVAPSITAETVFPPEMRAMWGNAPCFDQSPNGNECILASPQPQLAPFASLFSILGPLF